MISKDFLPFSVFSICCTDFSLFFGEILQSHIVLSVGVQGQSLYNRNYIQKAFAYLNILKSIPEHFVQKCQCFRL